MRHPRILFDASDYNRDRFIGQFARTLPAGARVLDAGAGTCKYKPLFSHCDYKAQDFAQYRGAELKYGELDYICDITAIPVPDATFDCIICSEVLEHVPYPERVIAELARVLRPGGKLALTAPLVSGIHMAPYHFCSGFSPYWYRHFMPPNGLEIESCRPNGGFFLFYGQESQRFLHLATPRNPVGRVLFFPFKLLFALWFKIAMPVACHFLDRLDRDPDLTVSYFVTARKTTMYAEKSEA